MYKTKDYSLKENHIFVIKLRISMRLELQNIHLLYIYKIFDVLGWQKSNRGSFCVQTSFSRETKYFDHFIRPFAIFSVTLRFRVQKSSRLFPLKNVPRTNSDTAVILRLLHHMR